MDDALGDALVVEVRDLLAQVVVLEQRRPALTGLQRVLGVAEPDPLGGGELSTLPDTLRRRCPWVLRSAYALRSCLVRLRRQGLTRLGRFRDRGLPGAGAPGSSGVPRSAKRSATVAATLSTVLFTAFLTDLAGFPASTLPPR